MNTDPGSSQSRNGWQVTGWLTPAGNLRGPAPFAPSQRILTISFYDVQPTTDDIVERFKALYASMGIKWNDPVPGLPADL